MELETISMSKEAAQQALVHYRKGVRESLNKEYRQIVKGLNRIARGQNLIELPRVIAAGGVDEKYRPRLAIIRADIRECFMRRGGDTIVYGSNRKWSNHRSAGRIVVNNVSLPRDPRGFVEARSVVPLIPPQFMPKGDLTRYHILWEASWTDVPSDPALLQHIGGDLWAVLAVWDLTPLEMAVLRGRAN